MACSNGLVDKVGWVDRVDRLMCESILNCFIAAALRPFLFEQLYLEHDMVTRKMS